MSKPSICCVVPSIRPDSMTEFRKAWAPLFERHGVTLITVWDGDEPRIQFEEPILAFPVRELLGNDPWGDLICRKTDAVRNAGFIQAARTGADFILTLDDDVHPPAGSDPIQEHLDVLKRRVPISWMNTAMDLGTSMSPIQADEIISGRFDPDEHYRLRQMPYLRGFPYGIRDEAQVMVSHGVWVNVPDFDGKTQLELGKCGACGGTKNGYNGVDCPKCNGTGYDGSKLPYSLPYFRGPVPKGCYLPFCGMNVMVRKEALPYLYFAPMGPDSGVEGLNRFADIWCGILLKRACDANNWAIYTGASTVIHTRASDPFKNVEQERMGMEWNETIWKLKGETPGYVINEPLLSYVRSWYDKANRFRKLILELQGK